MTQIIGVEQTTDCRHPETKIVVFGSRRKAERWRDAIPSGAFAWPGAADKSLPASQRNFHRRFRYLYEPPESLAKIKARVRTAWAALSWDSKQRESFDDRLATAIFMATPEESR